MKVLAFVWFLVATPAYAEVMDKELSVSEIWQAFLWALVVCAVAAAVWRWLLVPSFLYGVALTGLGFTWTEWFNSSVGQAMRIEAGLSYGFHLQTVLVAIILAHIAAWLVSSRWSIIAKFRRSTPTNPMYSRSSVVFAALLCGITALEASGGFSATAWTWISAPMLVAIGVFAASLIVYFRKAS